MFEVKVQVNGVCILRCNRKLYCRERLLANGLMKDEYGNIISNECGPWCFFRDNHCEYLVVVPTEKTKISSVD